MKKLICTILTAFVLTTAFAKPTSYNEVNEENWSEMNYVQVPIYKILDHKDGYVVIYAKHDIGVGQTVIPKKWSKGTPENPKKLVIQRIKSGKLKPFMAVVKNGTEFHHVVLTVPYSKQDATWGVVDYRKKLEGLDKDVLEDLDI